MTKRMAKERSTSGSVPSPEALRRRRLLLARRNRNQEVDVAAADVLGLHDDALIERVILEQRAGSQRREALEELERRCGWEGASRMLAASGPVGYQVAVEQWGAWSALPPPTAAAEAAPPQAHPLMRQSPLQPPVQLKARRESLRRRSRGVHLRARLGEGKRLDPALRAELEAAMGVSLGDVRVHTGPEAARLADELGAEAMAQGGHIAFADGAFQPDTDDGRRLIAHEVAHVIQQRQGRVPMAAGGAIQHTPRLEAEADAAANRLGSRVVGPLIPPVSGPLPAHSETYGQGFVQLKETKTEEARRKHIAELDRAAADAVEKLSFLVKRKGGDGNFGTAADVLSGMADNAGRSYADAFQAKFNEPLRDAISATFKGAGKVAWQRRYLTEIVDEGWPRRPSRLALALGLITHSAKTRWVLRPGDPQEVIALLQEPEWTADELNGLMNDAEMVTSFGRMERKGAKNANQIKSLIAQKIAGERVKAEISAGAADEQIKAAKAELATKGDLQLSHIIARYEATVGKAGHDAKAKLFQEVKQWVAVADDAERAEVLAQNSKTGGALKRVLKPKDLSFVLDLVRASLPQDALEGGAQAERVNLAATVAQVPGVKAADVGALAGLEAAFKREGEKWKQRGRFTKNTSYKHRLLFEAAEGLNDRQRELFVVSRMSNASRADYLSEDPARMQVALGRALGLLRLQLTTLYGFSEPLAAAFVARFRVKGQLSSRYQQFRDAFNKAKNAGARVVVAHDKIGTFREDDHRQLREDVELFKQLSTDLRADNKALGSSASTKRFAVLRMLTGEPGFDRQGDTISKHASIEEALEAQQANPNTWAAAISREVERNSTNYGAVAGIIHRAFMDAPKWIEAQVKAGQRGKTERDFMRALHHACGDKTRAFIKKRGWQSRFGEGGWTPPSAQWRIELSTRGISDRASEIDDVLGDMSGAHLLNDLSNFSEFKRLWDAYEGALVTGDEGAINTAGGHIEAFVLDVHPAVLKTIEKEHNSITGSRGGKSVGLVGKVRRKLAAALAEDAEFQAQVLRVGMRSGDMVTMEKRLRGLAVLDDEALSNKGVQWDGFSTKGALRREAAGQFKGAHRVLKGAHGGKNITDERALAQDDELRQDRLKADAAAAKDKAKDVDNKEGIWERRKDAFESMRAQYNARLLMVVNLLLTSLFAIAGSAATFGIGSPVLAALVAFSFDIVKRALSKGVETLLVGQLDVSKDAMIRTLIETAIQLGVTAATAASTSALNGVWENVAGTDWGSKHASGWGDHALDPSKSAMGYRTNNKAAEVFSDAAKEAGVALVNKTIRAAGQGLSTLITEADPLEKIKGDMGGASGVMKGYVGEAVKTFLSSSASNIRDQKIVEDEQADATDSQSKRDDLIKNNAAEADIRNQHADLGGKISAVRTKKLLYSPLTAATDDVQGQVLDAGLNKLGLGPAKQGENGGGQQSEAQPDLPQAPGAVEAEAVSRCLRMAVKLGEQLGIAPLPPSVTAAQTMANKLRRKADDVTVEWSVVSQGEPDPAGIRRYRTVAKVAASMAEEGKATLGQLLGEIKAAYVAEDLTAYHAARDRANARQRAARHLLNAQRLFSEETKGGLAGLEAAQATRQRAFERLFIAAGVVADQVRALDGISFADASMGEVVLAAAMRGVATHLDEVKEGRRSLDPDANVPMDPAEMRLGAAIQHPWLCAQLQATLTSGENVGITPHQEALVAQLTQLAGGHLQAVDADITARSLAAMDLIFVEVMNRRTGELKENESKAFPKLQPKADPPRKKGIKPTRKPGDALASGRKAWK